MTAFLRRIAFALGLQRRVPDPDLDFDAWMATTSVVVPTPEYEALAADAEKWRESQQPEYLRSFGANNVPVEDLGAEPMGWEKAP